MKFKRSQSVNGPSYYFFDRQTNDPRHHLIVDPITLADSANLVNVLVSLHLQPSKHSQHIK